ncbi:Vti1a [Columba guinea]|nr:Vti1a [Columba guinea]
MSSDFESYEQDFAVLTAEITGRIGKVPKLVGDDKKQMVANVEKQLEEARELLEQMELEVREIPPQSRGMYSSRMRSYKQEMGKLEADFITEVIHIPQVYESNGQRKNRLSLVLEIQGVGELKKDDDSIQNSNCFSPITDFPFQLLMSIVSGQRMQKRSRIAYSDEVRNELLGDDGNSSENQRAHLLDNTERLERSSRRLEAGYQIAVETALDCYSYWLECQLEEFWQMPDDIRSTLYLSACAGLVLKYQVEKC